MSNNRTVDSMEYCHLDFKSKNYDDGYDLPYRVYYPSSYKRTKKTFPLLFFMHGYGECGTENEKQIRVLTKENRLLDMIVERDDCIIVAPQCPADPAKYNWVPINKVWSTGSRELSEFPTVTFEAAAELLFSFVNSGRVDKSRVYLGGISMGGYAAWEMLTRYPDIFAAAVPVCGSGIPSKADRLVNIPIWAFHGLEDGTVPPKGTKDMENAIKEAGGTKMKATFFEGVGHNVWPNAYATPGLVDWLMSQKK